VACREKVNGFAIERTVTKGVDYANGTLDGSPGWMMALFYGILMRIILICNTNKLRGYGSITDLC